MTLPVETWAELVRAGDVRAISRAITAIENHQAEAEELLRRPFCVDGASLSDGSYRSAGNGEEHTRGSACGLLQET